MKTALAIIVALLVLLLVGVLYVLAKAGEAIGFFAGIASDASREIDKRGPYHTHRCRVGDCGVSRDGRT